MKTMRKVMEGLWNDFEREIHPHDIVTVLEEVEPLLSLRPDDSIWCGILRQVIIGCGMVMGSPPTSSSRNSKYYKPVPDGTPPFGHHGLLLALENFFWLLENESLFWEPCIYEEKAFSFLEAEAV